MNRMFKVLLLIILFIPVFSITSSGNSAEPPSIIISVPNAPNDLALSIKSGDELIAGNKNEQLLQTHYSFYTYRLKDDGQYMVVVTTANSTYEIELDESLQTYNNLFTLDIKNRTLTPGKSLLWSVIIVSSRVILTLIIEGIVFWLFRYRQRNSWIAFIIINLITQGGLNIWLHNNTPFMGYIAIMLIMGEFFVYTLELFLFGLVTEHGVGRRILYVTSANIVSLFAGGYLITYL